MKIHSEPVSSVVQKASVTFDVKECEGAQLSVLKRLQATATLPGFRKGKVPFELLKQRYGDGLEAEVRQTLLQRVLRQIRDEQPSLKIVSVTKADLSDKDKGRMLETEFEVAPQLTLPDYKNFPLEPMQIVVSEEERTAFIDRLRKQHATYETVERAVQAGDYVKLSYEGTVDGKPVQSYGNVPSLWGKQTGTWEEADAKDGFGIPEIVSGLVGLKAGDERDISVHFPENFAVEALRKKEGTYHVSVSEVREVKLPPLDEELFKKLQVKDAEQLMSFAEENIRRQKEYEYASDQKQRIAEFLIQSVTSDLPPTWIKNTTDKVLREMVNLFSAHGVKNEEMEAQKEDLHEKARAIAIDRVKLNLCFEKIFEEEKLKLESHDFDPIILQESRSLRIPPKQLVQKIQQDEALREDIRMKAFQAKMINWLFVLLFRKAHPSTETSAL